MKKRFVSLLLAISMILSLMPVSAVTAFAEDENSGAVKIIAKGNCGADEGGENLKWTLDNNGVLTISGSGAMKDYPRYENQRPDWYLNHKDSIRSVVLDNKITHIGDYAFDGCTSIKSVRYTGYTGNAGVALPESVTTIGVHAFSDTGVTGTLKLPEHLTEIDSSAFYHCRKLNGELKLPDTVKEKETEAEAYSAVWDLMIELEKNLPMAYVFYGQDSNYQPTWKILETMLLNFAAA